MAVATNKNYVLVIMTSICTVLLTTTIDLAAGTTTRDDSPAFTLTTTTKPPVAATAQAIQSALLRAARLKYGGEVPVEISRDLPGKWLKYLINLFVVVFTNLSEQCQPKSLVLCFKGLTLLLPFPVRKQRHFNVHTTRRRPSIMDVVQTVETTLCAHTWLFPAHFALNITIKSLTA